MICTLSVEEFWLLFIHLHHAAIQLNKIFLRLRMLYAKRSKGVLSLQHSPILPSKKWKWITSKEAACRVHKMYYLIPTGTQRYISAQELKESMNPPKHMGWQDPHYRCQAKITSTSGAPELKPHTNTAHTLLTRRTILSPCKTTTMSH